MIRFAVLSFIVVASVIGHLALLHSGSLPPAYADQPSDPVKWGAPADSVEVLAERTQNSKTFLNPDGSKTEIISFDLHYRSLPGVWSDVDLNFTGNGANRSMTKNPVYNSRTSPAGVTIHVPGSGKGILWQTPGIPAVAANRAAVNTNGLVWTYENIGRGIKASAVVEESRGPFVYTFPYQLLGNLDPLTFDNSGRLVSEGFVIPKPTILGSDGSLIAMPSWSLTGDDVSFFFDDSSLPAGAYPYVIDPTTEFGASGNNYMRSWIPDAVGLDTTMQVGDDSVGDPNQARQLVIFDLSSIDSGAIISDATMSLWEYLASGSGSWDVHVQKLRRAFVEDEATWNIYSTGNSWSTAGAADTDDDIYSTKSITLSMDGTAASAFVEWTSAQFIADVQDFVDGSLTNYGWRMQSDGEACGACQKYNKFRSRSYATVDDRPILSVTYSTPSAAITGTIGDGAIEQEVRDGGGTIIVTLTSTTWVTAGATFDATRQDIIDGLDSAESETNGWNAQVRDQLSVTSVVRTSNTIATITVSGTAVSNYQIDSNEVITVTVPASANDAGSPITAAPTITITAGSESAAVSGTLGADGGTQAEIVAGGETIIVTLTGTKWVESGTVFDAVRQGILDGFVSAQSEPNGWNAQAFAVTDVARTSDTIVTVTLSAEPSYSIPSDETVTTTVTGAAIGGTFLAAPPTFNISSAPFVSSGTRVSEAVDLSSVTDLVYCAFGWEAVLPATTTVTVETSIDGGLNYSAAVNGSCPTGLEIGESLETITDFRTRVTLTTGDVSETPLITALALLVEDFTGQDLHYQLITTPSSTLADRSGNSNTGTMSFPVAPTGVTSTADPLESTDAPLTTRQALPIQDVTSTVSGAATSANIFGEETGFDTLGLQGIVEAISGAGDGLPMRFVWYIFIAVFVIGFGMLMIHLTGDLLITAAAMAGMMGLFIAIGDGLLEGWILWVFLPIAGSFIMFRRGFPL